MNARPQDLLTNISNMCTKAEVTGSGDFRSWAGPAESRLQLNHAGCCQGCSCKFPLLTVARLGKTKRPFPRYSFPTVTELLKSFPVTTCFQTSCFAYTSIMWPGGRVGGGAESQALRLFPRQGNGAVESHKMACGSHSSEQRLSIQHFLNRSITPQKGARGGGWRRRA